MAGRYAASGTPPGGSLSAPPGLDDGQIHWGGVEQRPLFVDALGQAQPARRG
jgi:hypothetical protein